MSSADQEENDIFELLAAPFPVESVHWRIGSTNRERENGKYPSGTQGVALAYIDSRDVQDRLDQVVGPSNWQNEYHAHGTATLCRIAIKLNNEWVWKSDGAGETRLEKEKGQFSDAFKRAAVHWGVGRYLYSLPAPWVDITERGQISKTAMPDLKDALAKATGEQEWGTRGDQGVLRILQALLPDVYTPDTIDGFIESNMGLLKALPKASKEAIWDVVKRIQEPHQTAAE